MPRTFCTKNIHLSSKQRYINKDARAQSCSGRQLLKIHKIAYTLTYIASKQKNRKESTRHVSCYKILNNNNNNNKKKKKKKKKKKNIMNNKQVIW